MITMVSVILAFMLTMGGGPANTVNPVNPVKYISPGDNRSVLNINQKPHLGEKFTTPQIYRGLNFQKGQYKRALGFSFSKLPQAGWFLQTDPIGYQDSMNLYQAFKMNPVNLVDPMGEGILRLTLEKISM